MAIAFFVPPEYGPPQPQQPGQVPVVELHSNDINNNATPRAVNNPAPRRETLVSFLSSFVTELITVFGTQPRPVNNQARNESRSFRQRRPAAQQLPNIRISHEDNQVPQLPDLIPQVSSLPDLLSCEAGMSIRYNSTTSTPSSGRAYVAPLSPASSSLAPPHSSSSFEVSLKLSVGTSLLPPSISNTDHVDTDQEPESLEESYRAVGAGLRAIADNFEMSRRSAPTQSTFEFKIVISFALPSIAVVGLGLAYLRRSA